MKRLYALIPALLLFCTLAYSQPVTIPWLEDFESGVTGIPGTYPTGWVNGAGSRAWDLDAGGTSSFATGPTVDHTLGTNLGKYMYTETSTAAGFTYELISPEIDMSTATCPNLRFWYHMHGAAMGELHVDATNDGGATWSLDIVPALIGQQQPGQTDPWRVYDNTIPQFFGDTIQLRFRGVRGTSFTSDMAIDDVEIFNSTTGDDIGPFALTSPVVGTCGFTASEVITMTVKNFGCNNVPANSIDVTYEITGPINSGPFTEAMPAAVGAGLASTPFSFTNTADMSAGGNYTIRLWSKFNAGSGLMDGNSGNDTLSFTLINTLSGLPYFENFDNWTNCTFGVCSYLNGWKDGSGDFNWNIDDFTTSSGNTGPNNDHTTGAAGNYLYAETSSSGTGSSFIIESPCIDVTGATCPQMSFWYHMYGAQMGDLHVDGSSDGGITWTLDLIPPIVGQQQSSSPDPWKLAQVGLGGLLPATVINIRFRYFDGTSFTGDCAIDDVTFFDSGADDVGVFAMTSPNNSSSACGLTNAEVVTATIQNQGCDTIFSGEITATYEVTGPINTGPITEPVVGMIVPGGTISHSFVATADMSSPGNYAIDIEANFTTASGKIDGNALNDSLLSNIQNNLKALPWLEDFETFITGFPGTYANGWQNGGGTNPWYVDNGGTGTFNTGPASDHTLGTFSGHYLYTESLGFPPDDFLIESPCIDISGAVCPKMQFWYHMFGADITLLAVDISTDNGATWTLDIGPALIGEQQASNAAPWRLAEIKLLPYVGPNPIKIRFRSLASTGFTTDIAVDDVFFYDGGTHDIGVTSILQPSSGACSFTAMETVEICVKNTGCNSIPSNSILLSFDSNGPVTTGPVSEVMSDSLQPDSTKCYTFTAPVNLSVAPGTYDIKAYAGFTAASGLVNSSAFNDTAYTTVLATVPTPAPYLETFDNFGNGTPGTYMNDWAIGNGDFPWSVDNFTTPSFATGPSGDHTTGSGRFMYTEADFSAQGDEFHLISPCIDISSLTCPNIRFWYHMYGASIGSLHLDVTTDGGVTWMNDIIAPRSGEQQTFITDPWKIIESGLGSLASAGVVRFRIRSIAGNGFQGDIAIDDFEIFDGTGGDDVGITQLIAPATAECELGVAETITVRVTNFGCNNIPANEVGISYYTTGAVSYGPVTETLPVALPAAASVDYTFVNPINMSTTGTYNFFATADFLPASARTDVNPSNNGYLGLAVTNPLEAIPYVEDFESWPLDNGFGSNCYSFNGWENEDGDHCWSFWRGATNSFQTGPLQDHTTMTGQGRYMYAESNLTNSDLDTFVIKTPCIDLSSATCPEVSFWYHMYSWQVMGTVHFDMSTNGGVTWTEDVIAPLVGNQQTSMADGWKQARLSLIPQAGQTVKFRFRSHTQGGFYSDPAIDDFVVQDLGTDAGVTSIISPNSGCGLGNSEPLTVEVTNFGCNPLSNIPITYVFDGGAPVTETVAGPIASGASTTYTFTTPVNMGIIASYDIAVYTELPGETEPQNDTVLATVQNATPPGLPVTVNGSRCGPGSVTVSGSSPGNFIRWWDQQVGGTQVGVGNNYFTPYLIESKIYYAEAVFGSFDLAGPANPGPLPIGEPNKAEGIRFNVNTPITIDSLTVYPANPGVINVELKNQAGNVINSVNVIASFSGGTYQPIRIGPGFNIPIGAGYQMTLNGSSILDFYSTPSGLTYPISTASGSMDIIGNIGGVPNQYNFFYNMLVSSELCSGPRSAAVAQINEVYLGPNATICGGDSVLLDAGFPGSTYSWSTGQTSQKIWVKNTSIVGVDVNTPACGLLRDTILVNVRPTLLANTGSMDDQTVSGAGSAWAVPNGGSQPYTITWNTNPVQTTDTITGLFPGIYCYQIVDNIGCELKGCLQVNINTTTTTLDNLTEFKVYPNPTSGSTRIAVEMNTPENIQLDILDINGRVIESLERENLVSEVFELDLNSLPAGMYMARMVMGTQVITERIVLTK